MAGIFDDPDEAAEHSYASGGAVKPPHVLELEKALSLDGYIALVDRLFQQCDRSSDDDSADELAEHKPKWSVVNGTGLHDDKLHYYNLINLKKSKRWLKMVLLNDSSSEEEETLPKTPPSHLRDWLWLHKLVAAHRTEYRENTELRRFRNYSRGILNIYEPDKLQKANAKRKLLADGGRHAGIKGEKRFKKNDDDESTEYLGVDQDSSPSLSRSKAAKPKVLTLEQSLAKRKRVWQAITKKEIAKAAKQKSSSRKEMLTNCRKIAMQCMRHRRKDALQSQKNSRETSARMKRLTREMALYWKRFDKVERQHLKKAQKEAEEQRKLDLELLEARRQQRKLNYLITQTELYAHFMSRKLTANASETDCDRILKRLEEPAAMQNEKHVQHGVLVDLEEDDYDQEEMKHQVLRNAESAHRAHQQKIETFDRDLKFIQRGNLGLSNPNIQGFEHPQPSIFEGKLKSYQLKGMSWLINLYNQGINGILADEMGLGKTVQSIAFLAHLAESQNIWGPFLIVAPASTLHNWQQECDRFVPKMKAIPYWGNAQDRKNLRKYWEQQHLHTERASFHIVITSYQLVIQDVKYFQKIKWHYMVLDEAQALKSSSSARWKTLLDFNCRNRLLLTGTPIQNSMAELWALLHFIMPTLFDSHEEFNEWFSKDIESHVEKQSGIDESQLSRLHMILKPFMLRRVKKDVENELSDKIEILVYCPLTSRQRMLYQAIKNKIRIEDLLQTSTSAAAAQTATNSLMNLVMQFRKVCNHPELFERREARSPFFMRLDPYHIPKLIYREGMRWLIPSTKVRLLHLLSVFNPLNGCRETEESGEVPAQLLAFANFIGLSRKDICEMMSRGVVALWSALTYAISLAYNVCHLRTWHGAESTRRKPRRLTFLIDPERTTHFANVQSSQCLSEMVFVNLTSSYCMLSDYLLHAMAETPGHRRMRLKRLHDVSPSHRQPALRSPTSPSFAMHKTFLSPKKSAMHPEDQPGEKAPRHLYCMLTETPRFLNYIGKRVAAGCHTSFCSDRSAEWDFLEASAGGPEELRTCLLYGSTDLFALYQSTRSGFSSVFTGGLSALDVPGGLSGIFLPEKDSLIKDAGKMRVLDELLTRLKSQGHRVLIYSTMTRIIDILEEFMWYRKHSYMRLDGSSKIADRRDMVSDFQTKTDIFAFLLSTRAGGLGINLTAADTVIFYDSDWNPTVDQQAMDRAHRLGQTKQVTVYRLVCKGTIEERILQRAREKSEIQRMVISGGNFRPDVLKPKEVVSLLIDDDEIEKKLGYMSKKQNAGDQVVGDPREFQPGKAKVAIEAEMNNDDECINVDDEMGVDIAAMCNSPSELSRDSAVTGNGPSDRQSAVTASSSPGGSSILDGLNTPLLPKKRGRGRPKGQSSKACKPQQPRAGVKKVLSAAEIAGAQAGLTAAYAAYGYNITANPSSIGVSPSGMHASRNTAGALTATAVPKAMSSRSSFSKGDT